MRTLDNRQELRKNALIPAFASGIDDKIDVKCVIRDVSASGCRLVSTEIGDLPNFIHLVPQGFSKPIIGQIAWRDKKAAGVKFIDAETLAELRKSTARAENSLGFLSRLKLFANRGAVRRGTAVGPRSGRLGQAADYVAAMVHELRTPLTSLLGTIGLLANGKLGELPAAARTALNVAFHNAGRLSTLVNDLLDVKKIEAGRMSFDFAPHELTGLISGCLSANEAYGEKHGVHFTFENTARGAMARIDAGRIEQVLANLLSNAAKVSPEGEAVMVRLQRKGERLRISVSDRGPGIPAEMKTQIFNKFVQIDGQDPGRQEGTGLGLSIVKAIVEAHGSKVDLKSSPETGTTFWFDLEELAERTEAAAA